MDFKPMKKKAYQKWIGQFGWELVQAGSGDFKVVNGKGNVVIAFIKVTHPGGEVPAVFVKKTENVLKAEGLI